MANHSKGLRLHKKGSQPMVLKESHLTEPYKGRIHLVRLLKLDECQRLHMKKDLAVPIVPISSNLEKIIM